MTKSIHIGSTNMLKVFLNFSIASFIKNYTVVMKLITYLADETSNSRRNVKNDSNFYLSFHINPKKKHPSLVYFNLDIH
jgi:hypothetical protein